MKSLCVLFNPQVDIMNADSNQVSRVKVQRQIKSLKNDWYSVMTPFQKMPESWIIIQLCKDNVTVQPK